MWVPIPKNPVIVHEEIDYFLLINEQQQLSADISDNLGIDTAYVQYSINGEAQEPFALQRDFDNRYIGNFPFDLNNLNDGDEITYSIFAIDAANTRIATGYRQVNWIFSAFTIEDIFDPVSYYSNDF